MSKIMELADAYAESIVTYMGTPRMWSDDYQRAISEKAEARAALQAEVEKLEAKLAEAVSRLVTANQESHAWKYDCDALREKLATVEKDAARYQWLRDDSQENISVGREWYTCDYGGSGVINYPSEILFGQNLDAAIDAAMQEATK